MSYLQENIEKPVYTFVVFKKVGTYTDGKGEVKPVLEPVRTLTEWQAFSKSHRQYLADSAEGDYAIKVTRPGADNFEDFDDFYQRRKDLRTLRFLVSYGNVSEVCSADEFIPLEKQLRFKWKDLLEKYRSVLSEVDEKENEARHILVELLYAYRSGNQHLTVQEYLDKASNGFETEMKQASDYLRLFEAQDFIEITDFFTIRPKIIREFYDSHFETRLKSGKW